MCQSLNGGYKWLVIPFETAGFPNGFERIFSCKLRTSLLQLRMLDHVVGWARGVRFFMLCLWLLLGDDVWVWLWILVASVYVVLRICNTVSSLLLTVLGCWLMACFFQFNYGHGCCGWCKVRLAWLVTKTLRPIVILRTVSWMLMVSLEVVALLGTVDYVLLPWCFVYVYSSI